MQISKQFFTKITIQSFWKQNSGSKLKPKIRLLLQDNIPMRSSITKSKTLKILKDSVNSTKKFTTTYSSKIEPSLTVKDLKKIDQKLKRK
jgi:hypothetical protein